MNNYISKASAIILGAGDGKRMCSKDPKVMCRVLGKPMILWVTDSCKSAGIPLANTCVVVSDNCEPLMSTLPAGICTRVQKERLGTGHAVSVALDFVEETDCQHILVLYGDAPFVDQGTMEQSFEFHTKNDNDITVITAHLQNPDRYGRIVRHDNKFMSIVEYTDACEEQKKITEINSGIYWFKRDTLTKTLPLITPANAQGEYYLTDTIEIALSLGNKVDCFISPDSYVVQGANSRKALAELNLLARERMLDKMYICGVDIPISDGVMISPDATIGRDSRIYPAVTIFGKTVLDEGCVIGQASTLSGCTLGKDCSIGASVTIIDSQIGENVTISAGSHIENSVIGSGSYIQSSVIKDSTLGCDVRVGPFAHLRPNSSLADKVKIGNFVEIKNSALGEKTSVAHLTYIGDSDVGERVNFGCGVVTVNYDGKKKSRTTIGNDVFVGCNTNLIAPVTVEDGAYIAAATTITEKVPAKALAIGRVRQENKPGWCDKRNEK